MSVHQAPHGGGVRSNREHEDEQVAEAEGITLFRGGCHDSSKDRSPNPDPPGPRVFGSHIRSITKYAWEMNPGLWLEDYRLVCRAGGVDSDYFITCNLPLFLADST